MILILLFLFFLISSNTYADSVCLYLDEGTSTYQEVCLDACHLIEKYLNDNCETIPIDQINTIGLFRGYNVVYLATHGNDGGILIGQDSIYTWKDVLKIPCSLLVVDTCYSGYILDHVSQEIKKTIITASGKCLSVTKAFIRTLECYFGECQTDISWCNNVFDFGLCYMWWAWELVLRDRISSLYVIMNEKQLPCCIGSPMIYSPADGARPLR